MKEDITYYQRIGVIKELTRQINIEMENPSGTSIEDIIEMAQSIIDIMKKYEKELN